MSENKIIKSMFSSFRQIEENVLIEQREKTLKKLLCEAEDANEGEENSAEGETGDETESGDRVQLGKDDEYFKEVTGKISNLVNSIPISFNPVYISYSINKVEWSGKFKDSVEWRYLYSPSESGFYIDGKNVKVDEDMAKAIWQMEGYCKEEWLKEVQQKLREKDF